MNQNNNQIWTLKKGTGPLIATAIHDGHALRKEVAENMRLPDDERLREEDPFTSKWVDVTGTQIVALRSRFEVDLNRPREKAVYVDPEDCWGLNVWNETPGDDIIRRSLEEYDSYYENLYQVLSEVECKHGKFCLFDIHSFNHRRNGANAKPESAEQNPEVNIGTGTLDRDKWGKLIDRFIKDMRDFNFQGRKFDVRENVKFQGGHQVAWLHNNFAENGCGLAVEFKKFWMDEWTGVKDKQMVEALHKALRSTVPGVLEELSNMQK